MHENFPICVCIKYKEFFVFVNFGYHNIKNLRGRFYSIIILYALVLIQSKCSFLDKKSSPRCHGIREIVFNLNNEFKKGREGRDEFFAQGRKIVFRNV